ncbi:MAG: helix-turn-helix domain-containing protein [Chloroflexota bacterium]
MKTKEDHLSIAEHLAAAALSAGCHQEVAAILAEKLPNCGMLRIIRKVMADMENRTAPLERMLSVQEAAGLAGVGPDTLRHYVLTGRLHAVKVGRRWRIRDRDLERFMERESRGPEQVNIVEEAAAMLLKDARSGR